MPAHDEMGRFSVDVLIANARDVLLAKPGDRIPESIPHRSISAVVDTGAARLVIPQSLVDSLNLIVDGETTVRYADHRRATRKVVSYVWLQLLGRHGVFSAVVEPDRPDALLGAIVLEELDLVVDCTTQSLHPREPDRILTEIE
jgi:predicted aspartyl protease